MCITWATSCATAENTSTDGAPDATSVATRRNAACSSASRPGSTRSFARGSPIRADVPTGSSYPINREHKPQRIVLADDDVLLGGPWPPIRFCLTRFAPRVRLAAVSERGVDIYPSLPLCFHGWQAPWG